MSIIVDGYNYIGHSREFKLRDPTSRDKIVHLMGQYCGKVQKHMTIVFDGNYAIRHADRKRQYGRVTVIYTSPMTTADDEIKRMAEIHTKKRKLLVVSSDVEIANYVKGHGIAVIKSEDFELAVWKSLEIKAGLDRVNVQVSPSEVQAWLKEFEAHQPEEEKTPERPAKVFTPRPKPPVPAPQPPQEFAKKKPLAKSHPRHSQPVEQEIDRMNPHLSPEDVRDWMEFFNRKR